RRVRVAPRLGDVSRQGCTAIGVALVQDPPAELLALDFPLEGRAALPLQHEVLVVAALGPVERVGSESPEPALDAARGGAVPAARRPLAGVGAELRAATRADDGFEADGAELLEQPARVLKPGVVSALVVTQLVARLVAELQQPALEDAGRAAPRAARAA